MRVVQYLDGTMSMGQCFEFLFDLGPPSPGSRIRTRIEHVEVMTTQHHRFLSRYFHKMGIEILNAQKTAFLARSGIGLPSEMQFSGAQVGHEHELGVWLRDVVIGAGDLRLPCVHTDGQVVGTT